MEDLAISIIKNKKALVFAGGGTLGTAHTSAIQSLSELGLDFSKIESFSGSSVGSILAMSLAAGANIEYIQNKMNDTPFIELEDRDFILLEGIHLLKRFGIHETENLSTFISSILTDLVGNKDITFKQLHAVTGKWLTVTYLSLNYGRTIFADHIYEPNSLVREAVIKSCSIPIFYEAYSKKISHNNIRTKTMDVDGGMELNYPMIIPRLQKYTTEEILGFNFYAQASAQANSQDNSNNNLDIGQPGQPEEWQDSPTNIIDFLYNLVQIIRKQAMKVHVDSEDWMSTIKINVGSLTSTQFNLNSMEKAWLLAQGKLAVAEYIKELTHLLESNKYPLRQL